MVHELVIYQKTYDLILYAYPIINKMPRNSRFSLGQTMVDGLLGIARMIVKANRERDKKRTLWEVDGKLEELRLLIRLAKDLQLISIQNYQTMSEKVAEIGRLLGGWMKTCAG